ncbi:NAD(P)-dependent dehydrogenase (short-subunit alcohol dehydrogenase family) [Pseudacidovorax sp. 1753]|uniref:SDR family NAD(P)-dependent oxidoreductase n=1 Tax=Pseudacidovorax sp. 1753 TaxID=3156419 RepID=UPI0033954879
MTERIALVTGGNKGLGFETARRLKDMGFRVYIGAREAERGMEAASQLNVEWLQLDVTDDASVRHAAARLRERENRLDVLINNAGIAGSRKVAAELTGEDAESVFATNVVGPVRVMNAFIPLMETSTPPRYRERVQRTRVVCRDTRPAAVRVASLLAALLCF